MKPAEEDLFKAMSIGIMFRLGFQSLLTAAAQQRGEDALNWLDEFECRIVADANRMRAHQPIPERVARETADAVVGEFAEVFSNVRRHLDADGGSARTGLRRMKG